MKQTAIQWLMDRLPHSIETQFSKQIEQALEMERQQIIDANCNGQENNDPAGVTDAEQYYTQTFTEPKND
jgi:hypothetical protein